MRSRILSTAVACLLASHAWPAQSVSSSLQRDSARCQAGSVDACYDAIRWSPRDPALLVGLGDGLARSGKPVDALRNYRRAATISPNFPGLSAKINLVQARMSAKRPARPAPLGAANNKSPVKQYSNAAADGESH